MIQTEKELKQVIINLIASPDDEGNKLAIDGFFVLINLEISRGSFGSVRFIIQLKDQTHAACKNHIGESKEYCNYIEKDRKYLS